MRFETANSCDKRRASAGFTFAEILVAMLFLGVVLPTAMNGLRYAGDSGTLAHRKTVATRLGSSFLTELAAGDEWNSGTQSGQFQAPWQDYSWDLQTEMWQVTGLVLLHLNVHFTVRNTEHVVTLSTLVQEPTTQITTL